MTWTEVTAHEQTFFQWSSNSSVIDNIDPDIYRLVNSLFIIIKPFDDEVCMENQYLFGRYMIIVRWHDRCMQAIALQATVSIVPAASCTEYNGVTRLHRDQ